MLTVEHGVLVGIERDRLAVAPQVVFGGLHVVEGRLAIDEPEELQPARGVVDIAQHRAHRATVLEPSVLRSVDLDQLAVARAPRSGLLDGLATRRTRLPQPSLAHEAPERLSADREAVALDELLPSQRRSEVVVALADERHDLVRVVLGEPVVAWLGALAGDDPFGSLSSVAGHQALHLAAADPKGRCRRFLGQLAFNNPLNNL